MRTRRPFFLLFTNACILLIVLMMLMQSVVVLQLLAVADVLSGTVEVRSGATGAFHAIQRGEFIRTGDTIRSANDGTAEFRWIDGTRLRVEPNTQITVRRCSINLKKHSQNSDFALTSGKVFVRIPQKLSANSRFSISTPGATTTVKGTIFSVEAGAGKTEIAVWKGRVDVSEEGGARLKAVPEGELLSANGENWRVFDARSAVAQSANGAFRPLTNIIFPSLRARLDLSAQVRTDAAVTTRGAWLIGRAEAGDRVLVDGRAARVRGDGSFSRRVVLKKGANAFLLTAIDRHDATRTLVLSYVLK